MSPACWVVWCSCLQHGCCIANTPFACPLPLHVLLRFDFNLNRPVTPAEVSEVERLVNSWVAAASPTATAEMELDAARAAGATAMFGEKYDDVVRVVEVPGVSMELCGGEAGRQTGVGWQVWSLTSCTLWSVVGSCVAWGCVVFRRNWVC